MGSVPYRILGATYLLAGLPGLVALLLGDIHRGGNPFFAISAMGVPLGLVFLFLSTRPRRRSFLADAAVKLGFLAVSQIAFVPVFWQVAKSRAGFGTAYQFMGMFGSFLSLVALVLAVAALVRRPAPSRL
jgi:hypothetical protein